VYGEKRLDFAPQVGIACARLGQECRALRLRAIERLEKQILRPLMQG
jgi:hypothetical protein